MNVQNRELFEARERVFRKKHLQSMLEELYKQKTELTEKCEKLCAIMEKESADLKKFEGKTLSSFICDILGNREEKLRKEEEEAFEAKLKYSLAADEFAEVKNDINRYSEELKTLSESEKEYEKLFNEKAEYIKSSGGIHAKKIFETENEISVLKNRKKEIDEAVFAGKNARNTVDEILKQLDDARNWGAFDAFGGGFLAAAAKHDALDYAQKLVERLQSELRRFKTELADVSIETDATVNIEGFLRFADYFFDGFFVDWTVLNKIEKSQKGVNETKNQIENVLRNLSSMLLETEDEISAKEKELSEIIVNTRI